MFWDRPDILINLGPLALVCLAGLVWLWVNSIRSHGNAEDLAGCGSCGYAVRGWRNRECPECGADIDEVGIVTPKWRRNIGPRAFILLWTVLLPIPSCTAANVMTLIGPKHTHVIESTTLTPKSREYTDVMLFSGIGYAGSWLNQILPGQYGGDVKPDTITLRARASTMSANQILMGLEIKPATMTYTNLTAFPASGQASWMKLDETAWLNELQQLGADTTRQEIVDEARELITIVRQQPRNGLASLQTTNYTVSNPWTQSYDTPMGWWVALSYLIWPGVWIGGIVWYFRIRRRGSSPPGPETA